jgi:hypothetical protein
MLRMDAACSSETSVHFQRTLQRYIPKYGTLFYFICLLYNALEFISTYHEGWTTRKWTGASRVTTSRPQQPPSASLPTRRSWLSSRTVVLLYTVTRWMRTFQPCTELLQCGPATWAGHWALSSVSSYVTPCFLNICIHSCSEFFQVLSSIFFFDYSSVCMPHLAHACYIPLPLSSNYVAATFSNLLILLQGLLLFLP